MSWLRHSWAELYGLFVDDGSFAGAIVVWIVVAWLVFPRLLPSGWDAAALAVGLLVILFGNAVATALRSAPGPER